MSEAFHLPDRRVGALSDPGLMVAVEPVDDGWQLVVEAKRFARFVHIIDSRYRAAHDWFHLVPNRPCIVPLLPSAPQSATVARASNSGCKADATSAAPAGEVRALNAASPTFYG